MTDKQGVYLDSCCFIDAVKETLGQPLAADRANDVWYVKQLMQACRDGEIDVFTSTLAIAECTHAGGDISQAAKAQFQSLLMSGQYVKLLQVTPFIAIDARDLRWRHGVILRGADAVHIASALDRKCEEIITTDGQAKKIVAKDTLAALGLRVIRAFETQCLPAKYRQLKMPGS
jgi:hypothetical protein